MTAADGFARVRSLLPLLVVLLCAFADAKRVRGVVSSSEGFAFLAKFCFDYTPDGSPEPGGWLDISLTPDADHSSDIELLIYDDQPESWPMIYKKNVPCEERIEKAKNWAPNELPKIYKPNWSMTNGRWTLPRVPIHEHARPRFWYIVASNCRMFRNLGYDIQFINRGSKWNREFGVNVQGLNTLFVRFAIFYLIFLLVHLYGVRLAWESKGYIHPIITLISICICLQFIGIMLQLIHLIIYTENGMGAPFLSFVGELVCGLSRLSFTLLLILLAHGWTISTDEIKNRNVILAGMLVCFSIYFVLVLWDYTDRDPASTLYVYDSFPGYCIVALDIATGLWFHWAMFNTHKEENKPEKVTFYRVLWGVFGLWFFVLPIIVFVATTFLNPWDRERMVTTITLTISTIYYCVMAYLLWPTRAEQYFIIKTPDVAARVDYEGL